MIKVRHNNDYYYYYTTYTACTGLASSQNSFRSITDCVCSQDVVTYECTVCGLATAWEGTALGSCSGGEIALTNRDFMAPIMTIVCSGGRIAARGIIVEDGCFASQLNITFNATALQGRSVRCSVDNGTHASEVGRDILTLTTGIIIKCALQPHTIRAIIRFSL